MQYHSTRHADSNYGFLEAMHNGLARDGGLIVPCSLPQINLQHFPTSLSYPQFASQLLSLFIDTPLNTALLTLCEQAFNFPVPLRPLNPSTWLLELFHGPTLSFKDFGARFIAACMQQEPPSSNKPTTILVATSGDTGSAVAAAFFQKRPIRVIILFPRGMISTRQQQQITCWQDNVLAVSVNGTFDDCQRLVKAAFADTTWQQQTHLSTANSINIARLLPQIVYYAYTSLHFYAQHDQMPGFIIPSGNLGHATAAYWAKTMGFPIRDIHIATNCNRALTHYLAHGHYQAFPTETTLANAMDVGDPSNFARLQHLYTTHAQFKSQIQATAVTDEQIQAAILQAYQQEQVILCPHTATGYFARNQLSKEPWIIAATAHPCKFESVITPIIQSPIPPEPALLTLMQRSHHAAHIDAQLSELKSLSLDYF